jgi:pimeloyl-ACP methyl ester carboxylesterase
MSITTALGEQRTVEVPAGTIAYRESGQGRPLVFVHGVGVNGDLWRKVVPGLAGEYRCIAPDLPLGAHSHPLHPNVDLSLPGLAGILADFLDALELKDAVIVANDTGGAVAQWLVGHQAERVGALVLTSCDAFEKFPPTPQRYLELAGRWPRLMDLVAWSIRFKFVQRLPTAYGWVTSRPIEPEIMRSYPEPIQTNEGVRNDLASLLRAVDTRYTFEAAERLDRFEGPALVLWAENDKIFPREHGRRLANQLRARFELVADSRTFIPEEQPDALVALIRGFLIDDVVAKVAA